MTNNKKQLELLAPAGNILKLKTALAFGADAVYAGIPDFSLRVRINDFDLDKIQKAAEYCHRQNKKIYITVNIFAHNKHIKALPRYIKKLKKIGVDALIISDPGVISIVKSIWPEAEIHLSTQANCTNAMAAKFWFEQGVTRVILGREVTLEEIGEIHRTVPELELEYFIHGAMCMAYSGRCFLSKHQLDRSGNLGDCVQPCRWEYRESKFQAPNSKFQIQNSKHVHALGHEDRGYEIVEEEHGSYILNSKDLCLIEHLKELAEAGVSSFKIEGRAKSVYYQAVAAGIYGKALKELKQGKKADIDHYKKELETKLVHRGYTKGFLLGEKAQQNTKNSKVEPKWEFCGQVAKKPNSRNSNSLYSPKFADSHYVAVKVHNTIKTGDAVEIVKPKYDIIEYKVEKMYDPDSGEELKEAHGGQDRMVLLAIDKNIPEFSVIRRRVKN